MTVQTDIRNDFPILRQKVNGRKLIYLDNAASSQKPQKVLDVWNDYYQKKNSNVHRGAHYLSAQATDAFEAAREKAASFLNASSETEINFTKGTTEGVNMVAQCFAQKKLKKGDAVLISGMEHHSNIVPWQIACEKTSAELRIIPVLENGSLDMQAFSELMDDQVKIVSVVHASNSLGSINPVREIISKAHEFGAVVMLDAAQSSTHFPIDVQQLDCDFLAFSGHKILAPTGIGILYGKRKWLEWMDPYQYGGEMIDEVTFEKTTFNKLPYKFEAGTPNIGGAIALGAALDYIQQIGFDFIQQTENELLAAATDKLSSVEGLQIIGQAPEKVSVVSFLLEGAHPFDLGVLLDKQGIAIRTGHHCCQPLMHQFGIEGTARASFSFYNTLEEVDELVKAIQKAKSMLG